MPAYMCMVFEMAANETDRTKWTLHAHRWKAVKCWESQWLSEQRMATKEKEQSFLRRTEAHQEVESLSIWFD